MVINHTHAVEQFALFAKDIQKICAPLWKTGTNYFTYLKNYTDGSQICISSCAEWIKDYYGLSLYKTSLFERYPSHYPTGHYLWSFGTALDVISHGQDKFDSTHGLTIIKSAQHHCEFYFFSGAKKDMWLLNFYANNISYLNKFIHYFKDKAAHILKTAEKNRILIPDHYQESPTIITEFNNFFPQATPDINEIFTQQIDDTQFFYNHITSRCNLLSKREIDIIVDIMNGKTATESAETRLISKRTVEKHLENIKLKLSCRNKTEIVSLFLP